MSIIAPAAAYSQRKGRAPSPFRLALPIPMLLIWKTWMTVLLLCVGIGVTVHLVAIKGKERKPPAGPELNRTNPAE